METLAGIQLKGDAAFQNFFSGLPPQGVLLAGAVIWGVGLLFGTKRGPLTTFVLALVGYYFYYHYVKTGVKADSTWTHVMGMTDTFTLFGAFLVLALAGKKNALGYIEAAAIAIFLDVMFAHWIIPFGVSLHLSSLKI
jgi:hypothetical protein